jgi:hypothetical protein
VAYQTGITEGAPISGQSLESGGSGGLGWLASLRKALTDRLPAALTGSGNLKVAVVEATAAVTVTPPTLTKATQGGTGFSVQDLKDAGRVLKTFRAIGFTTATTEALITLTPNADGTDGSTGTSFTITSGKRLRLTTLMLTSRNVGAAVQGPVVKVRITATGAVSATSPVIAEVACQTTTATGSWVQSAQTTFPAGIELSGDMQIGISQIGMGSVAGNDVVLVGYEY